MPCVMLKEENKRTGGVLTSQSKATTRTKEHDRHCGLRANSCWEKLFQKTEGQRTSPPKRAKKGRISCGHQNQTCRSATHPGVDGRQDGTQSVASATQATSGKTQNISCGTTRLFDFQSSHAVFDAMAWRSTVCPRHGRPLATHNGGSIDLAIMQEAW